jgi:arylsulfatase A-like enzyme
VNPVLSFPEKGATTVQTTTPAKPKKTSPPAPRAKEPPNRLGPLDLLVLAAWCGLAGGLLEVGSRVLFRAINPFHRLYLISRHFVWLTPLVNLLLMFSLGLCLALLALAWPRFGGWIGPRLIGAFAILPILMVASPLIFPEAWFILALGAASLSVPLVERRPAVVRWRMVQTFPVLLAVDLLLASTVVGGDWLKQRREAALPHPPAGSPNVLFIVLDTVRADHLSLYGYRRPTTPTLERLAKRGIRFDAARATAPWTLMSHASFFTGRWPHELGVEWLTPLRTNYPMLAEYMAERGYATAGLVANDGYCSYETGLNRGFTHYEDYTIERLSFLRASVVVEAGLRAFITVGLRSSTGLLNATQEWLRPIFRVAVRRDAESINRGFLNWLDRRQDTGRPFFAFLNYFDAHTPYKVPSDGTRRFGRKPQTREEIWTIYDEWTFLDKLRLPPHHLTLARDCYDSCLVYLDAEIGQLYDDLERRGVLANTWIVITSDHGEGLGEHDLFEHGLSLYSTEMHVPLLIVPPSNTKLGRVVRECVSLRDLPATVVELAGLSTESPFPGHSLSTLWTNSGARSVDAVSDVLSELPSPNPTDSSHGRSPARRGPLVSLVDGDLLYIRNEADGTEELYNERDDPRELTNRAASASMRGVLQRLRERLAEAKR